ncbi:MAG: FAD-dependent oxidoreductase [Melioribacteraceae bacterium]|nr:FAD-dependent oxidoreductase [Melioribacteraceae bacterium]MCF8354241.1 FAD-dependent oxidoreductase [Melioribacteraceae bacterium]MCF8394728.1 FAD-dependent oxidoreductase [Melioribacteraceae bacterium]MCF8417972.1 FAD-dependent oxidoreductase [Melioribacteraceae bacterium]
MKKETEIVVRPNFIYDQTYLQKLIIKKLHISEGELTAFTVLRRSIDARKSPVFRLKIAAFINEKPKEVSESINLLPVTSDKKVIIVGSGPAGLFAAIRLIELGIKPIIFERGKDVQTRRKDLKAIQQLGEVNPNSNYCFGEGGAGTYSDGKLYTRSVKRGNVKRVLTLLHQHGAGSDILIDAHPHIGSNRLPKVVKAMRDTIINNNGEIYFDSKVTDLLTGEGKVKGVVVNDTEEVSADAVILATGHSARDIYYLLDKKGVQLEPKQFAMGVRVEHPQQLIDQIQYHSHIRNANLPAASYNLTCQVDDRGVYSFCMCPGGIIIPASTEPGELVLNGMSVSRRDSPFANSGLVVSITEKDYDKYKEHGVFAGLMYQKEYERIAFEAGGKTQRAAAQRLTDFIQKKSSDSLPETSYIPGVVSQPLNDIIPKEISDRLTKSIKIFGKRMKGFYTEEAQILVAESRTSSPVRIPRDRDTLMNHDLKGLFPSGEGAGYAGGIVSAAIDGENCADAAVRYVG